jgi:5-methylcytosine-specific restriction endonuclease McrA
MTLRYPDPGFGSLDHAIPLSKGGSHSYANAQLAHLSCNLLKSDKIMVGA